MVESVADKLTARTSSIKVKGDDIDEKLPCLASINAFVADKSIVKTSSLKAKGDDIDATLWRNQEGRFRDSGYPLAGCRDPLYRRACCDPKERIAFLQNNFR